MTDPVHKVCIWPRQVNTTDHDEGASRFHRSFCVRSRQGDVRGVSGSVTTTQCCDLKSSKDKEAPYKSKAMILVFI